MQVNWSGAAGLGRAAMSDDMGLSEAAAGEVLSTRLGPARLVTWVHPVDGKAYTTAALPAAEGGWRYICGCGRMGHVQPAGAAGWEYAAKGVSEYEALLDAIRDAGLSLVPAGHTVRHPVLPGEQMGFLAALERLPLLELDEAGADAIDAARATGR